ncbi:hypothetical protein MNBD_GAMMA12-2554 [hydrothermal vent metagenome]|uniref:WGR domain-containing protein n=1 Tax=hydrothermal vent metagenome TaxID=652676 RepID=A0A3B0XZ76_9ZZZZ
MIYLEHKTPSVNRFVELSLKEKKVNIRSGRIGLSGKFITLKFHQHHEAEDVYSRRLLKLYSKGYRCSRSKKNRVMLETIIKDPNDTSNYLVYSDLLQMQHEPRGKLIAVQYKLELSPYKKSLLQEESYILKKNRQLKETWWDKKTYCRWSMGFINSVIYDMNHDLSQAGWIRRMLMHPSFYFLRRLCLFNVPRSFAIPEVLSLLDKHLPQTVDYLEFCNSGSSSYGIDKDSIKPYLNINNVSNLEIKSNHVYDRRLAMAWLTDT